MLDNITLSEIAKMYYLEGLTQKQIGDKMGISRIGISRALKKCIEEGIVEIKIKEFTPFATLEERLAAKYPDTSFKVVPSYDSKKSLIKSLAKGAGEELVKLVSRYDNIGIGWGYTLSNIEIESEHKYPEKTFVSLLGGYGNVSLEMHSNHITEKLAGIFGSNSMGLLAPSIVDDRRFKELIINEGSIREVFEMYRKLDCVLCSLGNPKEDEATIHRSGYFKTKDLKELDDNNICCDVVSSFFIDHDGNIKNLDISNRIIGINPEDLLKVPNKVIVAGGEEKMFAIYLALKNRLIDRLITDEKTAEYLLDI